MEKKAIYEEIGKTLAPVEYDGEDMLEMFGITKKDLVPYMVGNRRIMVYPYPAPEEVCREMLRELKERYGKELRNSRCMIAGVRGGLKSCPENYSCSECPVGMEKKQSRQTSLDLLLEEGLEIADSSNCLSEVNADLFLKYLDEINPRYSRILILKERGYTETEIGQMLQVPRYTVMNARKKIREIAVRYFGKETVRQYKNG